METIIKWEKYWSLSFNIDWRDRIIMWEYYVSIECSDWELKHTFLWFSKEERQEIFDIFKNIRDGLAHKFVNKDFLK